MTHKSTMMVKGNSKKMTQRQTKFNVKNVYCEVFVHHYGTIRMKFLFVNTVLLCSIFKSNFV